jgi:hypothetical protein
MLARDETAQRAMLSPRTPHELRGDIEEKSHTAPTCHPARSAAQMRGPWSEYHKGLANQPLCHPVLDTGSTDVARSMDPALNAG